MPFVSSVKVASVGDEGVDHVEDFWNKMTAASREHQLNPLAEAVNRQSYKEAWTELQQKLESQNHADSYKYTTESLALQELQQTQLAQEASQIQQSVQEQDQTDVEALFHQGIELYNQGNIREAVICFERITLSGEQKYLDESWRYLGMCHSENDEDKKAITCFNKCLDIDPYNLDALLAMGTSYVNEMDSVRALDTLRCWVTHNPSFQSLKFSQDEYSDGSLMDEVTQLMLAALNHVESKGLSANTANDIAEVSIVLGVLYNVSHDYDCASTFFDKAFHLKGNNEADYALLNKMGATLANNNKSREAIPLYAQALKARPSFTRGWLNLGISFANMERQHDAAKAYIEALKLNPEADHIWSYLRVVLTWLERLDAVQAVGKRDIDAVVSLMGYD